MCECDRSGRPRARTLRAGRRRRSPSAILAPAFRCGQQGGQVGTKQRPLPSNKATDIGAAALLGARRFEKEK